MDNLADIIFAFPLQFSESTFTPPSARRHFSFFRFSVNLKAAGFRSAFNG
jgi:hypothetical protein